MPVKAKQDDEVVVENTEASENVAVENTEAEDVVSAPGTVVEGSSAPDEADDDDHSDQDEVDLAHKEFVEKWGVEGEKPEEPAPEAKDQEPAEDADTEANGDEDPTSEREKASEEENKDDFIPEKIWRDVNPAVKARIGKQARKIKDLEANVTEVQSTANSLKEGADKYEILQNFNAENKIEDQQFISGMNVMAAYARGDAQTVYDGLKETFEWAQQALGLSLPPDVQKQVDDGLIMPEAASQLVQAQEQARLAEVRAKHAEENSRQLSEKESSDDYADQTRLNINQAEIQVLASDPDHALKSKDDVMATFRNLFLPYQQQKIKLDRDQIKALVETAYRATPLPKQPVSKQRNSMPMPGENVGTKKVVPVNETAEDEAIRRMEEFGEAGA